MLTPSRVVVTSSPIVLTSSQVVLNSILFAQDFKGNVDHSNVVVNALPITQRARFVRFYPTASHHWPCLRVEVFVEISTFRQ